MRHAFLLTSANYASVPPGCLRLWRWLLLAALTVVLSGCDAAAELWRSLTDPDYEVLDSGVGTSRREIFWLDNERVIFSGIREPKPANQAEKHTTQVEILIWDVVEDTITSYRKINRGRFCYADGRIYYDVREEERPGMVNPVQIYMAGPMGEETLHEFPMDRALNNRYRFNWYSCRFVKRPAAVPKDEGWEMLHPEHGYLTFRDQPNSIYSRYIFHTASGDAAALPFTTETVNAVGRPWFEFKGAYFLERRAASKAARKRWRESGCLRGWWLSPRGALDELCIPSGVWSEYGADLIRPLRNGFVFSVMTRRHDFRGLHVWKHGQAARLIGGLAEIPVVSPNGCKVAFAHAPNFESLRAGTPGRRTLKAVNTCK